MAKNLSQQSVDSLINQALAIEDEAAREAGALGFMAKAMVQATLPHRKVEGNKFERRNGAFTLTLQAPSKIGLPYGTIPRLLLAWVTTEAVQVTHTTGPKPDKACGAGAGSGRTWHITGDACLLHGGAWGRADGGGDCRCQCKS